MNWINKIALLIGCLCILKITNAQINISFIHHLYDHNLKKELETYLWDSELPENDSLFFEKALFGIEENNEEVFQLNFQLSQKIFYQNECALNKAALFNFNKKNDWFKQLDTHNLFHSTKEIILYKTLINKIDVSRIDSMPIDIAESYREMIKFKKKKLINAILLSTVLPGLGEIYAGRRRAFFPVLLTNTFYVAQSVESISKFKVNNGLSILNLSLTGIFYVSNIYGTYYDLKKVKKEKQQQFEIDAINYFSNTCQCLIHQ